MRVFIEKIRQDILKNARSVAIFTAAFALLSLFTGGVCSLVFFTGIPCPWCGLTRAAIKLLCFDFVSAFKIHPLVLFYIAGGIWLLLYRYKNGFGKRLFFIYIGLLAAATAAVYAIRMALLFPHTEPMKYEADNLFSLFLNFLKNIYGG